MKSFVSRFHFQYLSHLRLEAGMLSTPFSVVGQSLSQQKVIPRRPQGEPRSPLIVSRCDRHSAWVASLSLEIRYLDP
ncbi:MAG TPA: hypothetical protein VG759_21225, partial [Candidatus Angelobacter sp.]|nr:hypothetical protein [Candidatus Angelobacter sp.]